MSDYSNSNLTSEQVDHQFEREQREANEAYERFLELAKEKIHNKDIAESFVKAMKGQDIPEEHIQEVIAVMDALESALDEMDRTDA